jgi:hypothetical protein
VPYVFRNITRGDTQPTCQRPTGKPRPSPLLSLSLRKLPLQCAYTTPLLSVRLCQNDRKGRDQRTGSGPVVKPKRPEEFNPTLLACSSVLCSAVSAWLWPKELLHRAESKKQPHTFLICSMLHLHRLLSLTHSLSQSSYRPGLA